MFVGLDISVIKQPPLEIYTQDAAVKVICSVMSQDKVSFRWKKNGSDIAHSSDTILTHADGMSSLTIPRIKTSDAGNYSCIASGTRDTASREVNILVKGIYNRERRDFKIN